MKKIIFILFLWTFISCRPEKSTHVFQGDLEDFVVDSLSFKRKEGVGFMGFHKTTIRNGKELLYTKWNETFQFFDVRSGRRVDLLTIPTEGPKGIKGRAEVGGFLEDDMLLVTNSTGNTNIYFKDTLMTTFRREMDSFANGRYIYLGDARNSFHSLPSGNFELTFNPFEFMAIREGRDGLDLSFTSWIGEFDRNGKVICESDFLAPYDKSFGESTQGGKLVRMVEEGESWAMFPYSDSLYQIKNCEVIQRLKLNSLSSIYYFPEKYEGNKNSGRWVKPEDGASNLYLIKDVSTGLFIRFIHLREKRNETDKVDLHQKMVSKEVTYLMLIYDEDWKLLAELEQVYYPGTKFENLFSTSEGLFINKPEQKSEDEYEFYKIDLSQFRN